MEFEVGQLVQCKRALHPGHIKLVGCIGEIKIKLNILEQLIFNCQYVVFFPNYPEGKCPYCDKVHSTLEFLMWGIELKPIEDPDQDKHDHTDEKLPQELDA